MLHGSLWKQTFDDFNAIYESWQRRNDSSIGSFLCVLSLSIQLQSPIKTTKEREKKNPFPSSICVNVHRMPFVFISSLSFLCRLGIKLIFSILKMLCFSFRHFSYFFSHPLSHFILFLYLCDEMCCVLSALDGTLISMRREWTHKRKRREYEWKKQQQHCERQKR